MAAKVILGALASKLAKVNNLLAICLLLSIVLPGVVEARPVDGETGGETQCDKTRAILCNLG